MQRKFESLVSVKKLIPFATAYVLGKKIHVVCGTPGT